MRSALILGLTLSLLTGCASGSGGGREMAAVAPMLSVERFLQAANARDLDAMANLFGTADGPVANRGGPVGCAFKKLGSWIGLGHACQTRQQVELRMDAIARILNHEDYRVQNQTDVAGRDHPTTRIGVDLTLDGRMVEDVPFFVVKTSRGRWLVEQIGLEKVTQRR